MSAAESSRSTGNDERRAKRRRRKAAAATGTMLLVAAAVAGEPIQAASAAQAAGGVGGGLYGLTDPDSVSANGEVGDEDKIGDEVLASADNIDRLRQLSDPGDLPTGPTMIPGPMYDAYLNAASILAAEQPNCHLHWSLLASIGRIESNHARGGRVDGAGNTTPNILGPVLNGGGFAAIRDTDGGRLDGDARWDRAVGAMQFIPSTWRGYVSDGNNDGLSSPHNVFDATVAAGKYLCSGGLDLADAKDRATAVFRYNHSDSYVSTVLIWAEAYAKGMTVIPQTPVPNPAQLAALGPKPVVTPPAAKPATNPKPGTTTTTTTTVTPTGTTTTTTTTTTPCDPTEEPTETTTTTEEPTTTTTEETSATETTSETTTTTEESSESETTTTTTTTPC
ncbi:hypothetical protein [Actinophytocola sp.]|uniref:lytic transglycosylase domain-containing protein n=1 Tax=Actinophytocola sp. TaxID=1872138 RepID=UPI0025C26E23|nr:hypothetical protein [Actinophytocola sp.]